jgi:hypothetical protein
MSKMDKKARTKLAVPSYQVTQSISLPKNEVAEENTIYVSQLQELARIFSSSADKHIRQYIINLAKGVIERADDYKKIEGYINEMTN